MDIEHVGLNADGVMDRPAWILEISRTTTLPGAGKIGRHRNSFTGTLNIILVMLALI